MTKPLQTVETNNNEGSNVTPTYDPKNPILVGLNEEQIIAVTAPSDTIMQILAGPGTGKTKTLAHRTAYLIEHYRVDPSKIVLMTFTRAAAAELSRRVQKLLKECVGIDYSTSKKLQCGTFHSICRKYLVKYGKNIELSNNFQIINGTRQKNILEEIVTSSEFKQLVNKFNYTATRGKSWTGYVDGSYQKYTIASILKKIAEIKTNQQMTLTKYLQEYNGKPKFLNGVMSLYNDYVTKRNYLDFTDLLIYTLELFKKSPHLADGIDHILIDEFQDTDAIQFSMMKLFAGTKPNPITVVGDPDQSIYGFRNAVVENFQYMRDAYPSIKIVNLIKNYRSSQKLVDMSQEMISLDSSRIDRERKIEAIFDGALQLPTFTDFDDRSLEFSSVASQIKYLVNEYPDLFSYSDFAILFRAHKHMEGLEPALIHRKIPYYVTGGIQFWERKEISIFLDFFRVISTETYPDAIYETMQIRKFGLGKKKFQQIVSYEADKSELKDYDPNIDGELQEPMTLLQKIDAISQGRLKPKFPISAGIKGGLRRYMDLINSCIKAFEKYEFPRSGEIVFNKLQDHLSDYLSELATDEAQREARNARVESLKDLVMSTDRFVQEDEYVTDSKTNKINYLATFLQMIEIEDFGLEEERIFKRGEGEESNKVTISTIHAAKGLEWPVVFIPCLDKCSVWNGEDSEERRVLYVSITRPACLCYISQAKKGSDSGSSNFYSSYDSGTKYEEMLPWSHKQKNPYIRRYKDKFPTLAKSHAKLFYKLLHRNPNDSSRTKKELAKLYSSSSPSKSSHGTSSSTKSTTPKKRLEHGGGDDDDDTEDERIINATQGGQNKRPKVYVPTSYQLDYSSSDSSLFSSDSENKEKDKTGNGKANSGGGDSSTKTTQTESNKSSKEQDQEPE